MLAPRFYGRSAAIRNDRAAAERVFVASHANPFALLGAVTNRFIAWLAQPRVMVFAAVMVGVLATSAAASAGLSAGGATGLVGFMGLFEAKRSFPITPIPTDGGTSEFKITRGMIQSGLVISNLYSVNVTGAGAAVRAYSVPVRRVSLIGDNGKTLQSWRATDLIRVAQIWEQTPIGALLTPASAAAIANYTGLQSHIPLMFKQPRAPMGDRTSLPTFAYADLTLRVEWGTVTELFTTGGALAGAITFTAGGSTVTQLDYADIPIRSNAEGLTIARAMPVSVGRYIEMIQAAVANSAAEIDLGTTANIRAIMLVSELTSNGEPTNTIVSKVSLQEDNTNFVFSSVPWDTIRADNSKHFGLTMPTGVAVIDFADDGKIDLDMIYRATQKTKVRNLLETLAVAGTVRAALMTIEPPLRI